MSEQRVAVPGVGAPAAGAVSSAARARFDVTRAAVCVRGPQARSVLEAAAAAAQAQLGAATLRSVHERTGRSVSAVYEATLGVGDAARQVLLVAHVDARRLPAGALVLERGDERVAVWRFPHDPFLPGLASAVSPTRVRELLDGLGAPAGDVVLHTRAYRPSRRAVVEVGVSGPDASGRVLYLKVLAGDRAQELAGVHRALQPYAPVPPVVGVAAAQGIVALEALPGRTLHAALAGGGELPDPAELVELSSRLAASGLVGRRDPVRFADPLRHVDGLAALVPDRGETLAATATWAATLDGPRVAVHGDLHDGQVLLDDDGHLTGLLDLDGAGQGLLAYDVGNLVAHVEAAGELWPEQAERAQGYAASLADAYRPLVGASALARATAAAWIALATGPYRAQEPDWPERTRLRIDRAAALLAAS